MMQAFEIEVDEPCVVNLSMTQLAKRALPEGEQLVDISFIVMEIPEGQ